MSRLPLALAMALSWASGAGAQEIFVSLDRPDPFEPAFGEVEMLAHVEAEELIERVVFSVDGMMVGEVSAPPFRLVADLGQDNVEHTIDVVAYGASGATGTATLTTPRFRVDDEISVSLQQLYVTVTQAERRVLDLGRGEFQIHEKGTPQVLVTFERGDVPFTALVLVDSSESMRGEKLRGALAGARAFFDGMLSMDEGGLIVFSDRIQRETPFTTFPEVLAAGLDRVRARGGTALNDHLYLALKRLQRRQGRRVVILLSDGVDSHSVLEMETVLARARRDQALIYWLRLPFKAGGATVDGDALPSITTPWRNTETHRQQFRQLERTVIESGGRIELLNSLEDIGPAFRGIRSELREQYVLGFYPANPRRDGSWRKVRVTVGRAGVEVRTRGGYLDF